MTNKYSAMYYPDCYVDSPKALATYLLLYDEIHLVALSDEAKFIAESQVEPAVFELNNNKGVKSAVDC